jgi:hypothetical protein
VIVLGLDAATLGRVRLAPSPTFEVLAWLKLVASGRRHPVFGDPGASARFAMREPDVALLGEVVSAPHAGYTPDFLTPAPPAERHGNVLGAQLETVRVTPEHRIADEIDQRFGGRAPDSVRNAMESGTLARRAADGLRTFWRHTIADRWNTIAAALAVDVFHRSATMSAAGVGSVLQSLDPAMGWDGDVLRIDTPWDFRTRLTDADLVLTPFRPGLAQAVDSAGEHARRHRLLSGRRDRQRDQVAVSRAAEADGCDSGSAPPGSGAATVDRGAQHAAPARSGHGVVPPRRASRRGAGHAQQAPSPGPLPPQRTGRKSARGVHRLVRTVRRRCGRGRARRPRRR